MSFSSDIKDELTKIAVKDDDQRISELIGFIIVNASVTREDGKFLLKMSSESEYTIRRIFSILKSNYNIISKTNVERPKIPGAQNVYHLKVQNSDDLKKIFDEKFFNLNEKLQIVLENKEFILDNEENQKAFLRGVFLGSGSCINPEIRYHLEFTVSNHENALFIKDVIESFDISAKMIKRKKDYTIYLKLAESVSTFLIVIGSNRGTLKFEETRVIKEVRNNINRKSNFENANFDKTLEASLEQIEDIKVIRKSRKFAKLPENLKETARLRLNYKEATLEEIGNMLNPPISRAGVNHRFKKIHEIAESLRKE
ncbi:MAG: DNA-binding protein WhiA [Clostridia bacterium]|nr:DNA-binding protein WhiA [Clostridia bacterium]